MRFFCLLLVLLLDGEADAQIFRRLSPLRSNCVNGRCEAQILILPSPADPDDGSKPTSPSGKDPSPSAVPDDPGEVVNQPPGKVVQPDGPEILNFGVDWDKIDQHKIELNGKSISCHEAIEQIKQQVPDDRNKLRLVVIGTPSERAPAAKLWDAADDALKDRVSPWFCSADHWSLRDNVTGELRFKTDGHPTAYLLAPDGESLGRIDGFTSAQDVEAIRKAVKKYDAAKDADLRRPDPPKVDEPKKTPSQPGGGHFSPTAFAVGAGFGLVLLLRKGVSR